MAYINQNKLLESEFDIIVSIKDQVEDKNNNQSKLKVHDTYGKDEKISTNFQPIDDLDVINKDYLDENFLKLVGQLSILQKNYNEFKTLNNKQSIEEVLIQKALITTKQTLYDKSLFDNFPNADSVVRDFCMLQDVGPIQKK